MHERLEDGRRPEMEEEIVLAAQVDNFRVAKIPISQLSDYPLAYLVVLASAKSGLEGKRKLFSSSSRSTCRSPQLFPVFFLVYAFEGQTFSQHNFSLIFG